MLILLAVLIWFWRYLAGPPTPTVADALAVLLAEYQLRKLRSLVSADVAMRCRLLPRLGHLRLSACTSEVLRHFVEAERATHVRDSTIMYALRILSVALRQAHQRGELAQLPAFPRLRVDNARRGFVTGDGYARIRAGLPPPHQDVADFAYLTGWRRGEILALEWDDLDREQEPWTIRLPSDKAKTGYARRISIAGPLRPILERRLAARYANSPRIFHRGNGLAVHDLSYRWHLARTAAGLPGCLFHDLRRTALRNLIRAGVPERVAQEIGGHRSRSMLDRYNIVSGADTARAFERLDQRERIFSLTSKAKVR